MTKPKSKTVSKTKKASTKKAADTKPVAKKATAKKATAIKATAIKATAKKPTAKKVKPRKITPEKVIEKKKRVSSKDTSSLQAGESTSKPVTDSSLSIGEDSLQVETSAGIKSSHAEIPVKDKLIALYGLQQINSQIDRIRIVIGELPLEVRDLEDEIEGLETRILNYTKEVSLLDESIASKKNEIKDADALLKKYEKQKMNVRNNREYESISKEIEFQSLEKQLFDKKIKENKASIHGKKENIDKAKENFKERKDDLKHKRAELEEIVAETKKEEEKLTKKSIKAEKIIEERLLTAYKRIRKNARNGLAVVSVERDACGGCFNKIPPQRQLDIRLHKKVIVCEHCGRILIDHELAEA